MQLLASGGVVPDFANQVMFPAGASLDAAIKANCGNANCKEMAVGIDSVVNAVKYIQVLDTTYVSCIPSPELIFFLIFAYIFRV